MAVSANRLELLQIADAVAREKLIDKDIVISAMADAIQKAAKSRYGQETNIRADINTRPARSSCSACWKSPRSSRIRPRRSPSSRPATAIRKPSPAISSPSSCR
jgi:hypothetical protein